MAAILACHNFIKRPQLTDDPFELTDVGFQIIQGVRFNHSTQEFASTAITQAI